MRTVVLGLAAGSSVALAAALGAGCGGTGGDNLFGSGVGGATTSASVTGSGTPVTSTSTTGTSDTTVTSTTTSGSGPSTTTTTTSSGPTTTSTTSTGSGGGKCDPAAGDDACTTCTKASCCNDVVACSNDGNCTCWVGCLQQHPNNYQICFGQCGNPDGNTTALAKCTTNGGPCTQACGGGGSTTTTGSGGGACSPQAGDSACASCTKMKCCSSVMACATDTNCQCWTQCLGNGGGTTLCQQICGGFDGTTTQLFQCSGSQCQGSCQ